MHSQSFTIRLGVDMDRVAMLEVFNAARKSADCFASVPASLKEFDRLIEGEEAYVAVVGNQIAGFVSIWPPDRFIHHLYVAPLDQNRGIGSSLLRMCMKKYRLPLSLKCETANQRALKFYKRNGWVSVESGVGPDGPWERLCLNDAEQVAAP